jgi:RNA polymerase sigma-70 factor (ECF subfamily)
LNGNQAAQETLYNKYNKIVKDFIRSKYSTYYDVDDDVSEILIKIFLNLKNFDAEKSKFKSWALSITKNHMIDKWRCNTTTLSLNNLSVSSTSYDNTFTNQSLMCASTNTSSFDISNAVNFVTTQLSASDYTLLDMKYVQGYSYNEIGKEFQLTSSTVSNKINYIKTKLKNSITEDIFD